MEEMIKRYIERGWKIIRLRANSKAPADVGWTIRVGLSEEEALEWFKRGGNIGLQTGISFIVLDVDDTDKFMKFIASNKLYIPNTPTVITASGKWHYYFALPEGEIKTRTFKEHGFEIRAEGQQVVAPPSKIDGNQYQWVEGTEDLEPAPCPEWLLKMMGIEPQKMVSTEEFLDNLLTDQSEEVVVEEEEEEEDFLTDTAEEEWEQILPQVRKPLEYLYTFLKVRWTEGIRHELSLSLAGAFAKLGIPKSFTIEKFIIPLAEKCGDVEIKDRRRAIEDTYEKAKNRRDVKGITGLLALFSDMDKLLLQSIWQQLKRAIKSSRKTPILIRAKDLQVPSKKLLVGKIIRQGDLVMIYGRPKAGKSFLSAQITIALLTNQPVLGMEVREFQGNAAIFAYDDPYNYIARIRRLGEIPDNLYILNPKASLSAKDDQELIALVRQNDIRFAVIDLAVDFFAPLLPAQTPFGTDYASTRAAIKTIRPLLDDLGITVVLVHHARKGSSIENGNNVMEALLGSQALAGSVDVGLFLQRSNDVDNLATLHWWGREIKEGKLTSVQTETGFWELAPEEETKVASPQAIYDILVQHYPDALNVDQIIEKLEGIYPRQTVKTAITRLVQKGKVIRVGRGLYKAKPTLSMTKDIEDEPFENLEPLF